MHLVATFSHLDELRVDLELADVEATGGLAPRVIPLAQDLLYPRHELARVDRRAHVIVRAELDAHDAIHSVLVSQEGHRRDPGPLDGADNLKPPLIGQTVVHDRDLEALPSGHLPRLSAGTRGDHTPPLPRERPPKVQPLFVVSYHKQNGRTHDAENHPIHYAATKTLEAEYTPPA